MHAPRVRFVSAILAGLVFASTFIGSAAAAQYKLLYSFAGHHDGAHPLSKLLNFRGNLLGTTQLGGAHPDHSDCSIKGCGTVFSITRSGSEHLLYAFTGRADLDGSSPFAPAVSVDGVLFGTTRFGGA